MNNRNRIVPVSLCVSSMLLVLGCGEQGDSTVASVKQASQQTTTERAPRPETPKTIDDPKVVQADLARQDVAEIAQTLERQAPPPALPISTELIVKAEPAELDLGEIATNDTGKGIVKLVNTGDKPMTINSARPSCGCTTLKFVPGTVLGAGETLELELQMTGGPRPGPLSGKTVTFVVEGQPEVVVRLKAQAISFVTLEPAILDPSTMPDGKFKLTSVDGQPFHIKSVMPAVIDDLPTEAQTEFELAMSWEKFREIGVQRQAIVYLDHPKCQNVMIQVNFSPEEVAEHNRKLQERNIAAGNLPTPAPAPAQLDPDTQLANLIKEGKNEEVLQKIHAGLDPNHRDSTGLSVLGMAARSGNVELIQALLASKKAELEGGDNIGRTPLMHAATSKSVEAVRILLDAGANPTTRDSLGTSPLSWAAWLGDAASVRELIEAGSDVEVVGAITGWTPLILAAGFGDPAAIDALVDAKANIEVADFLQGATPLIHAARTGKVEGIKALLKHSANLENADRNGYTPLLSASSTSGGDVEKVKALLEAGANIHAKDNRGLNALELARKRTDIRAPAIIALLEPLLGAETAAATERQPKKAAEGDHAGHDHSGHSH